jgi:hypothetical protein
MTPSVLSHVPLYFRASISAVRKTVDDPEIVQLFS